MSIIEQKFYMLKKTKQQQKNFMALFYGWGSTASRLQPLRGGVTSVMKDIFMEQLFVLT